MLFRSFLTIFALALGRLRRLQQLAELLLTHSGFQCEDRMRLPLVDGRRENSNIADGELHYSLRQRRLGADGADQHVVAICYGGIVEERKIKRDERARLAAGSDAVVDGLVLGCRVHGRGGSVRNAHGCGGR